MTNNRKVVKNRKYSETGRFNRKTGNRYGWTGFGIFDDKSKHCRFEQQQLQQKEEKKRIWNIGKKNLEPWYVFYKESVIFTISWGGYPLASSTSLAHWFFILSFAAKRETKSSCAA